MTVDSGHKVLVSAQGNGIIGLRNLRVIYFFAHSDDHVQKHIASANNFLINLVA